MAGSLGTISGQVRLDVSQAISAFAAMRTAQAASSGAMATAGKSMTLFGKAAFAAGAAVAAGFGLAIDKAAEFEKKMDFFGAVTGSTASQMDKVRDAALQMGRTSQFSASQIADAFVEMGKAGVSADDITDGLAQSVVNLASAADINLTEATNIVTSQIQAYSLTAKDAAHVTDELAGAANASIVDVSDLGVSLKYVGGVAHALGITFDSTTTALSLLGKAGIKGSTAGTSLRQIMVSLAGGTSKAKDELKALGIITADGTNQFFDANGKAKDLATVFQILKDHTAGLSQEEQLMAFRTIFNNRALAAAEILTKAGAQGFAQMNDEISKTTAADVAAKRMDNLAGDIKKLKGNIDTLLIQAGTPFQEFLRNIVQHVTHLIQAFARLSPHTQTMIFRFIEFAGTGLLVFGALVLAAGAILKVASGLRTLAAAFKLMTRVTKALTVATLENTAAALTNPYVLLAVAIVALIAGLVILYFKCKAFRDIMDAIGRGIATGFMATVHWFEGLPKFFSDLWKSIANWFNKGVDWVVGAWDSIVAKFNSAVDTIVSTASTLYHTVIAFFVAIPGYVASALVTAWNGFVNFIKKMPYYIGFAIGWILGITVRFIAKFSKWIWGLGEDAMRAIITWFSKLPGRIEDCWNSMINGITKFVTDSYNAITKWATDSYNFSVDWFSKLPGRILNFFFELYHNSITFFNNFINSTIQWAQNTYNSVIDWFQRLPGRVADFFVDLYHRALNTGRDIYDWAHNFGSDVYNTIADWFGKLPDLAGRIMDNVIDALRSMVNGAIDAAKQFGEGIWDGFKKGLGINSPSLIEKQMWQITKVTDTETKRLASQVRVMQNLAGRISKTNPAKAATETNTARMVSLTQGLKNQADLLRNATDSIFPSSGQYSLAYAYAGAGPAANGSGTGLENGGSQRPIIVNNYNPIAERGSDSASKRLRTLSHMGAF